MKSLIILAAFSISLLLSYASAFSECDKAKTIEGNKNAEIEKHNLSIKTNEREIKEIEDRLNTEKAKLVEDLRSAGVTLNDIESRFNAIKESDRMMKNRDLVDDENMMRKIEQNYLRLESLFKRTNNYNTNSKKTKEDIEKLEEQNSNYHSNITKLEKEKPIKITGNGNCILDDKKSFADCKAEAEHQAFKEAQKNTGVVLTRYAREEKMIAEQYTSEFFEIKNTICPPNETDATGWYNPDGIGGWRYAGRKDTSLSAGMKYVYEAEYVFDGETLLKLVEEKIKVLANGKPEVPEIQKEPTFEEKKEEEKKKKEVPLWLGAMVFHGGEGNEFQLVPAILFAGSVGSYFYFDSQYKENWSKYESSTNSSDRRASYDKARESLDNRKNSLYVGIGIWAVNVIYSFIQDNQDMGKSKNFSPITTYIIPQPDGGAIVLSYSF